MTCAQLTSPHLNETLHEIPSTKKHLKVPASSPGTMNFLESKPPSSPDRQLAEDGQHESLQQAVAEDLNRGWLEPWWWTTQAKDMLHRGTLLQRAAREAYLDSSVPCQRQTSLTKIAYCCHAAMACMSCALAGKLSGLHGLKRWRQPLLPLWALKSTQQHPNCKLQQSA